MLKPETVATMTPEERTALFETLATGFYGTNRYAPMIERDFDVTRGTPFSWRRKHNVPWSVLYTLDAWANSNRYSENLLSDWSSIAPQLAETAHSLARVAGTLASIGRRMPSPRGPETAGSRDAPASSTETQGSDELQQSPEGSDA